MLSVLAKLFVRSFYQANAGFFLFFFFIFFGAVEGSSLVTYHLSLMKGLLQSPGVLSLILICWLLYHLKCISFFLRVFDNNEGTFLYNLQTLSGRKLWLLFLLLYTAVYAPVLVYSLIVISLGLKQGYVVSAVAILLFQVISVFLSAGIIYHRAVNWLHRLRWPTLSLPIRKTPPLYTLFYFTHEPKFLLLGIKSFSLLLLYFILVWNKGPYHPDSFLLFYLLILLAHTVLPYLAVRFWEFRFSVSRNLPLSLFQRAGFFLLPYCLLALPETVYLFMFGQTIPLAQKMAYVLNWPVSLFLLTSILYSEGRSKEEYVKACFAVFFVSVFFLHVQALWLWMAIQMTIALLLFFNGYYRFEKIEEN